MGPIRLNPTYLHPIWGGTAIAEARGIPCDTERNHGESFDVSAHEGVCTSVAEGPYVGTPLDQLIRQHHDEVIGDLADDTVLQMVCMDARQNLSIQVHPDEEYARRVEGDREKAESWYIFHAEPGATLIAGCLTDDVDALRAAAADDTVGDRFGQRIPVQEGDFVLIPAGTMHALGAGIFAGELGSFGNTTYRLCDWGRGRPLQVEKGFDVLRTQNQPTITHLGKMRQGDGPFVSCPAGMESARPLVRPGVRHRLFQADVADVHGEWHVTKPNRYQILTCVSGSAQVETAEGSAPLPYTCSLLIPACVSEYTVRGTCRVIVGSRP